MKAFLGGYKSGGYLPEWKKIIKKYHNVV
jgi:hypothetical protein